jgi:hypothetical protein
MQERDSTKDANTMPIMAFKVDAPEPDVSDLFAGTVGGRLDTETGSAESDFVVETPSVIPDAT